MKQNTNPVAIVTGGARGIGKAIVRRLACQGASVVLVDNNNVEGNITSAEMQADGLDVKFFSADVGKTEDVRLAVKWVEKEYSRIDWIVNNAGFGSGKTLAEIEVSEFERILDVNLKAAFLFAKFGADLLRKSPVAAIVNISSTRALMSEPGDEAYSATKAGLLGLTHALANSLGPRIRVNAICPGWIDVGKSSAPLSTADHLQHPVGRVGQPEDIAQMAAFLLSTEASFITGQSFVVDGGMTKKMIYID